MKMNLDTGAAVNTFPLNFGPEVAGDGRFYEWIPDGEVWQFQGYDENGLLRSLNGTSNQLENLVQMLEWETKKMRNVWKQKFHELE